MKTLHITLATVMTLALLGCGGGSTPTAASNGITNSTDDLFKIKTVKYTLNGSAQPTCHDADDRSGISSSSERMTCQWLCGLYEGGGPVHVLLAFEKENGIWQYESDYVSTASSLCKN